MKKIFLIFIFISLNAFGYAQSLKDTKDFIKLKLDELKLRIEVRYPKTINPTTISSDNVDFNKNYMIIQHNTYNHKKSTSFNNIDKYEIDLNNIQKDWIWVDLRKIKIISFEKIDKDESFNIGGLISFNGDLSNNYYNHYYGEDAINKSISAFNKDSKITDLPNESGPIEIRFLNYNLETLNKIKNAFKHLVKLSGGVITDDLF